MVIGIDGPAGAGKTTIAKIVARRLGILYLDTGATYRALTLKLSRLDLPLDDEEKICEVAKSLNIEFKGDRVYLDGEDVTLSIRTPQIDKSISKPVSFPRVRKIMVELQRRIAHNKDVVAEGRDVTSVVFPNAECKFYLDAKLEERAYRRFKELRERGINISLEEVTEQVKKRDQADLTRFEGPLKKVEEAIYIDTSGLGVEQVVRKIVNYIKKIGKIDSVL